MTIAMVIDASAAYLQRQGLDTLADYLAHSPSMGIVAGRYGNRIGGAKFPLDGREVILAPNERGHNQLHGGPVGFGKRGWRL
eukprot:gene6175-biopygen5328